MPTTPGISKWFNSLSHMPLSFAAEIAHLHGPIGLDLGGRSPEETALAIMAEIVAARRGGTGRPLCVVATEKDREAGS